MKIKPYGVFWVTETYSEVLETYWLRKNAERFADTYSIAGKGYLTVLERGWKEWWTWNCGTMYEDHNGKTRRIAWWRPERMWAGIFGGMWNVIRSRFGSK